MTKHHTSSGRSREGVTQVNKKIVTQFYQEFYVNQDLEAAAKYVSEDLRQHRPNLADGRKAMIKDYADYLKEHKNHKEEIRRVIADGDLVALHVAALDEPATTAVVDIFRVQNGKIVEHWDVCQTVPEKSANNNTMF